MNEPNRVIRDVETANRFMETIIDRKIMHRKPPEEDLQRIPNVRTEDTNK